MKKNESALVTDIDINKVRALQRQVTTNSRIINGIVDRLVSSYCKQLDDYVTYIGNILKDAETPPTDDELDRFALNIPVFLYFTGEAQEALGIQEDVAEAAKLEIYNEVFNDLQGTIPDKTAKAELATQSEYIVHVAYQRAYKKVKLRMDAANELLQSVKKVISRRISAYELSRVDPQRIGGINGSRR